MTAKAQPKVLAHLKGLAAALWPLWEVWQAANTDGAISSDEYSQIGKAFAFFVTVWLVPNIGYVRALRGRLGQRVEQGVDETHELPTGKHEFVDSDHDGISDEVELRANQPGDVAARKLR